MCFHTGTWGSSPWIGASAALSWACHCPSPVSSLYFSLCSRRATVVLEHQLVCLPLPAALFAQLPALLKDAHKLCSPLSLLALVPISSPYSSCLNILLWRISTCPGHQCLWSCRWSILPFNIRAETLSAAQEDIGGEGPVSPQAGLGVGRKYRDELWNSIRCH